jgi:hypothetical protein
VFLLALFNWPGESLILTLLPVNPDTDVAGAIFQPDVIFLASRQELHPIAVNQSDILQVQSDTSVDIFLVDKFFQLRHVLTFDPSYQGKNNFVIG